MAAREPVFQQNHLFQQISEQVRLKKSLINNTEGAAANEDTLDWKALFRQYCYDFTLNPTAQLIDCRHLMDHPKPALVNDDDGRFVEEWRPSYRVRSLF
jgi:hypothetical protein